MHDLYEALQKTKNGWKSEENVFLIISFANIGKDFSIADAIII